MAYGEENVSSIKVNEICGTVALSPAVSTHRLVNNILRGLRGDHDVYDCAFLKLEGHLKKFLPYMTSIAIFGRYGVSTSHLADISGSKIYRLKQAYFILRACIHLGKSYVHGLPNTHHEKLCVLPCDVTTGKVVEKKPCEKTKLDSDSDLNKCEDNGGPNPIDSSKCNRC